MSFKIGDIVKLRESNQYGAARSNPAVGSGLECEGHIDYVDDGGYSVAWGNGEHNGGYSNSDLILAHRANGTEAEPTLLDWPGDKKATIGLMAKKPVRKSALVQGVEAMAKRKADVADIGERRLAGADLVKEARASMKKRKAAAKRAAALKEMREATVSHHRAINKRRSG
jgi:hypothetical protein